MLEILKTYNRDRLLLLVRDVYKRQVLGRKLAARVLKTWIEDFVDEDTGEVAVSYTHLRNACIRFFILCLIPFYIIHRHITDSKVVTFYG